MNKAKPTITTIWIYLSTSYQRDSAYTKIRRHFRRAYPDRPDLPTVAAYFPVALMCAVREQPGFDVGPVSIDFEGLAEAHFNSNDALHLATELMTVWKGPEMSKDDGFHLAINADGSAEITWPALARRHQEANEWYFSQIQKDRADKRWGKDKLNAGSTLEPSQDNAGTMPVQCRDDAGIMPALMPSNNQPNKQPNKHTLLRNNNNINRAREEEGVTHGQEGPEDKTEPRSNINIQDTKRQAHEKIPPSPLPPNTKLLADTDRNPNDPNISFLLAEIERVVGGPPPSDAEREETRRFLARLEISHPSAKIKKAIQTFRENYDAVDWKFVRLKLPGLCNGLSGPKKREPALAKPDDKPAWMTTDMPD